MMSHDQAGRISAKMPEIAMGSNPVALDSDMLGVDIAAFMAAIIGAYLSGSLSVSGLVSPCGMFFIIYVCCRYI